MNKLKKTVPVFAAILLILTSAQLHAEDIRLDIKQHVLDNGLKILVLERRHSPTVSVYMYYPVGSANEITNRTGISHFIEHLMSKGTRTLCTTDYEAEVPLMEAKDRLSQRIKEESGKPDPDETKINELRKKFEELEAQHGKYIVSNEIDKIYTAAGAQNMNAATYIDWTRYHVSLPKNKLGLWCAIESEIMRGPVFREFYTERDVVAEERRMNYDDDPGGALYEQLIAAAYTTHPYGVPTIGSMADIQNYTREYVHEYYRRYYAPNRATVVVVGDVAAEEVFALINDHFADIPRQPDPPGVTSVEPPQRGERRVEVEFEASPKIGIAFHKMGLTHPDQPVFDVLAQILSSGRTSRLYRRIVEDQQIGVSVGSGSPDTRYPSLYYIFAVPRGPHTVEEIETSIYGEIEKLKKEKVSDWELQRAKNRLTADFILELRSNDGLADTIGFYSVIDSWEYVTTILEKWNAVTAEDIQRVVGEYLIKSNRTVAYIIEKK
jgi:predicted Zn-dependent peptidase